MVEKIKHLSKKPSLALTALVFLGLSLTGLASWGLWNLASQSLDFKQRDDRMLIYSITLNEKISAFSKLTYDFLIQQDFNRMMLKEKQSDSTRKDITQALGGLSLISDETSGDMIETVRFHVMQFLTLTDKALDTAVQEGSSQKARVILQDEVEPALKKAQGAVSDLIQARQKLGIAHVQAMRQEALKFIAMLIGLTALCLIMVVSLRNHVRQPSIAVEKMAPAVQNALDVVKKEINEQGMIKAPSLSTLAFLSRFTRLNRESDELRKMIGGMQRLLDEKRTEKAAALPDNEIKELAMQNEKIAMAVGRIQQINGQSKQFMDKLSELMSGMQGLATEGNMAALNVTIEFAKLQAQLKGNTENEKNVKISEQIRALATTAASITGKMAMVLSQYKYAQEDFAKQTGELLQIKDNGALALAHIRTIMMATTQSANTLFDARSEFENYLPIINSKVEELEQEIEQMQLFANEELDGLNGGDGNSKFKLIQGRAA